MRTIDKERLEYAVELLNEVRQNLDTRTRLCGECGLTHYRNKEQWQAADKLNGLIGKLKYLLSQAGTTQNDNAKSETRH